MKALLSAHAASLAALSVLTLTWAGCHEQVVVAKDPPPTPESEPNDSASDTPWYGTLAPGSRVALTGHITSDGPDFFDGFAFTTGAPCTLRFTLAPSLPGTDLDLCLYDPWLDEFVACFDGTAEVETGQLGFADAGTDFHLVVTSAWASSNYLLQIEVVPFVPLVDGPGGSAAVRGNAAKHTLERVRAYRPLDEERARELGRVVAAGWMGEIDLATGRVERAPFVLSDREIAVGDAR